MIFMGILFQLDFLFFRKREKGLAHFVLYGILPTSNETDFTTMSDTVITTIKRVSLFKTPDNQVHESKLAADQHMDALLLKKQIRETTGCTDHEAARIARNLVACDTTATIVRRMRERNTRMKKPKTA